MIIKKLVLENFQSHKHTELEFHPHYNVIVGSGHAGKTSIYRALSVILYGQWFPSWVRQGAAFCKITLITDNGTEIIREKGEKVNKYILKVPNQKEQIYESFGRNVPPEIEKLLQVQNVQIDAKEFINLNFASQRDSDFILTKPGSFKAKVLGKLSGAHYLDYALRELNKDKRNLSGEKNLLQVQELELRTQLVQYSDLSKQKAQLDSIHSQIETVTRKMEFISRLKQVSKRISEWKQIYTVECEKELKFERFNLEKTNELKELADELAKLKSLSQKISDCDQDILTTRQEIKDLDVQYNQSLEAYFKLLKLNKKCPTCFNEISDEQLIAIKTNL